MVVFEDGLPRKSEYRRFVVRGRRTARTTSRAMHEVISRRFRRLLDERADGPSCGDGPTRPGRLAASTPRRPAAQVRLPAGAGRGRRRRRRRSPRPQRALDELGIDDVAVCGLAKRLEEVWLPGEEDPVILPRTQRGALPAPARPRRGAPVRDHLPPGAAVEVDGRGLLDDVPGLGEVRRKALLRQFGSLKRLRAATVEEIAAGARASGRAPPTAIGPRCVGAGTAAAPTASAVNTAHRRDHVDMDRQATS